MSSSTFNNLTRLLTFSDGVFAIAMTLLALQLHVPPNVPLHEVGQAILAMGYQYLGFTISFFAIGGYWIAHHRLFLSFKRYNGTTLFLNLLMLFFIVILPFPTSLIGNYGDSTFVTIFYALGFAMAGLAMTAIWVHGAYMADLVDDEITPARKFAVTKRTLIAPLVFLLSIPIALFNPHLAQYSWLLMLVLIRFV